MAKQTETALLKLSDGEPQLGNSSFDDNLEATKRWSFSGTVSNAFDTHVRKSVPDYEIFQNVIVEYASFFISEGSRIYDIGCSTGTTIKQLANRNQDLNLDMIGIDCVEEMVLRARDKFSDDERLKVVLADAVSFDYLPMDLVICCLSLQFINKQLRHNLIKTLYRKLRIGGAIIIFEKTLDEPSALQSINSILYNKFKVEQGLTPDQIISKANALIGVLDPYTQEQNFLMLREGGFTQIGCIYKNLCFEGYIGIK